jgi:hypothetical protein
MATEEEQVLSQKFSLELNLSVNTFWCGGFVALRAKGKRKKDG